MIDNIKEKYEAEFETLLLMIKSEHPCEFLAVNQLADELILINEHNINSPFESGEVLEFSSNETEYIHNNLQRLLDDKQIVLRHRPLNSNQTFNFQSMVAFFDIWRDEFDEQIYQYQFKFKELGSFREA